MHPQLGEDRARPQRKGTKRPAQRPVRSVGELLASITPVGAHALGALGTPLPLVRPWSPRPDDNPWETLARQLNSDHPPSYVTAALGEYVDYPLTHRLRLAEVLQPDARDERPPVWQGASAALPTVDLPQGQKGPTKEIRCVMTAIGMDVEGRGPLRWNRFMDRYQPQPHAARSERRRGRLVLHRLGAWPWACAADGGLPKAWSGARFPDERLGGKYDERAGPIFTQLGEWQRNELARLEAALRATPRCP